jgi:hypothetical protein
MHTFNGWTRFCCSGVKVANQTAGSRGTRSGEARSKIHSYDNWTVLLLKLRARDPKLYHQQKANGAAIWGH